MIDRLNASLASRAKAIIESGGDTEQNPRALESSAMDVPCLRRKSNLLRFEVNRAQL